jgi:trehalose 6-phosphate phosphatase
MELTLPTTEPGRAALAAVLERPSSTLLATDLDGTLAPIVADPDHAFAHPGAAPTLARLDRLLGAVAVVTGRPTATALRLSGLGAIGSWRTLQVLGQYGLERWDGSTGETRVPEPPPGVALAREELPELLARHDAADAHVEDKGLALGVHTRRLPDPQAVFDRLRGPLADLAERTGLRLEPGRAVLELRPPDVDKGSALAELVEQAAAECVLVAGDDLGDRPAFEQVHRWRESGRTGLVLYAASAEQPMLAELADLELPGPDGVVGWLTALADRLES